MYSRLIDGWLEILFLCLIRLNDTAVIAQPADFEGLDDLSLTVTTIACQTGLVVQRFAPALLATKCKTALPLYELFYIVVFPKPLISPSSRLPDVFFSAVQRQ